MKVYKVMSGSLGVVAYVKVHASDRRPDYLIRHAAVDLVWEQLQASFANATQLLGANEQMNPGTPVFELLIE